MALIKRYELKTGLSADNAYHVITRLDTIKRVLDEPNINDMRPEDAPEYTWKAGYFAMIVLSVFASKTNKEAGNSPIAVRSVFPTGSPFEFGGEVETTEDLVFEIDINSEDNMIKQAYNYLKTLPYYQEAIED
jgi:hypothetical protein